MIQSTEFECFVSYALTRLTEVDSIAQIADEWEAKREHEEVMDDIRQVFEDIEAGRGIPLSDALAQLRQTMGLDK